MRHWNETYKNSMSLILLFLLHNSFVAVEAFAPTTSTTRNTIVPNKVLIRRQRSHFGIHQSRTEASSSSSSLHATATLDFPKDGGSGSVSSAKMVPNVQEEEEDVKVGVLLLNLGGPEKSEDVEGKCRQTSSAQ